MVTAVMAVLYSSRPRVRRITRYVSSRAFCVALGFSRCVLSTLLPICLILIPYKVSGAVLVLLFVDSSEGISKPAQPIRESQSGGHAVFAVGYKDKLKITNRIDGAVTTGAFLIRNSWGARWGDGGYGWLPYEYVLQGLAIDWWTLSKNEWVDTDVFTA